MSGILPELKQQLRENRVWMSEIYRTHALQFSYENKPENAIDFLNALAWLRKGFSA